MYISLLFQIRFYYRLLQDLEYSPQCYTVGPCCLLLQLCPTLCDPLDCSPPGSSVHGVSQARILEWVAISFSRGIFPIQGLNTRPLCLLHWQAGPLRLGPLGKPFYIEQCISVNPQTFIYPLIPFPFCNHTFVFDILTQFFF